MLISDDRYGIGSISPPPFMLIISGQNHFIMPLVHQSPRVIYILIIEIVNLSMLPIILKIAAVPVYSGQRNENIYSANYILIQKKYRCGNGLAGHYKEPYG